MSGDADAELVARAADGDDDAFAELVRRHHAAIRGLCLSMLDDAAEAEDAAQEAFLSAHKSLKRFQGKSTFGSWLYRIAANRCLDRLRRRKRDRSSSLDALLEEHGDAVEHLLGSEPDASLTQEQRDLVARVLGGLSPEHRLILTLRETQGLDYKELTETLDCSLDAVKARLRRARIAFEEIARHFLESDGVE
jgi:RNA polymerase sigma-70 factor (ECF subfamily)